jgi:uncharacterized membrane protein
MGNTIHKILILCFIPVYIGFAYLTQIFKNARKGEGNQYCVVELTKQQIRLIKGIAFASVGIQIIGIGFALYKFFIGHKQELTSAKNKAMSTGKGRLGLGIIAVLFIALLALNIYVLIKLGKKMENSTLVDDKTCFPISEDEFKNLRLGFYVLSWTGLVFSTLVITFQIDACGSCEVSSSE